MCTLPRLGSIGNDRKWKKYSASVAKHFSLKNSNRWKIFISHPEKHNHYYHPAGSRHILLFIIDYARRPRCKRIRSRVRFPGRGRRAAQKKWSQSCSIKSSVEKHQRNSAVRTRGKFSYQSGSLLQLAICLPFKSLVALDHHCIERCLVENANLR